MTRFQRRLANRFSTNPTLRMLVLNTSFLLVLTLLLLGALTVAVCVPRIWVTSPPGFQPKIKISLVDRVQAWSLRRSARKAAAAGKEEEASRAWRAAIANNRADPEPIRSFLRHTAGLSSPNRSAVEQAVQQAQWLLRLTRTNRSDLSLVVQTCDRVGLPELVLGVCEPIKEQLSPAEEACYQKSLFLEGKLAPFKARIARFPQPGTQDPEVRLCVAALAAGWATTGDTAAAREQVTRALDDPEHGIFACRVRLILCAKLMDPDGYAEALKRLEQKRVDRVPEHTRYWLLLANVGRGAEARPLVEGYPNTPRNASEVIQLAEAQLALGLQDYATRFINRFIVTFGEEPSAAGVQLWMMHSELLSQTKAWEDLRAAAVQMRASKRNGTTLAGLSYYLEGRALTNLQRPDEALAAFKRAAELPFPAPATGLSAGEALVRMHQPALALKVLHGLASPLQGDGRYWQAVFDAAYALKTNHVLLLEAARNAYQIDPKTAAHRVNYAAALLINRQDPDEASKLTLTFLQEHPNSVVARVNHCLALAMNQRLAEAEAILKTIDALRLNDLEATVYHLCWVEIRFGQRQYPECQPHLAVINPKYLFPVQVDWLAEVRAKVQAPGQDG